ncbi:hypothetical protein D3C81_1821280 [compost metagenome]
MTGGSGGQGNCKAKGTPPRPSPSLREREGVVQRPEIWPKSALQPPPLRNAQGRIEEGCRCCCCCFGFGFGFGTCFSSCPLLTPIH